MGKCDETAKELSFRKDGSFTIVQFTDIHWKDGSDSDRQSLVLDAEQPDLVMFTGDVIYTGKDSDGSSLCTDPLLAFCEAVAPMEQCEIPWALCSVITIQRTV